MPGILNTRLQRLAKKSLTNTPLVWYASSVLRNAGKNYVTYPGYNNISQNIGTRTCSHPPPYWCGEITYWEKRCNRLNTREFTQNLPGYPGRFFSWLPTKASKGAGSETSSTTDKKVHRRIDCSAATTTRSSTRFGTWTQAISFLLCLLVDHWGSPIADGSLNGVHP